jgi:N-acetyl sugar amidotransferase
MFFNVQKWSNISPYRQCSRTVMDTISDPFISFDDNGECNYSHEYDEAAKLKLYPSPLREQRLASLVSQIRSNGKGKKYDCVTGVSGGVDSTYLLYKARELGLNPLVVHFDNGWNSELAVGNIENCIKKLGFDLFTVVVDWNEFRDLQLSYFKANVVDIEAITDHAILASLYKAAIQNNVPFILSGNNHVTEGILPRYWIHNKADSTNIKAIHRQHGSVSLKSFPLLSPLAKRYNDMVRNISVLEILNYFDYNKDAVKKTIVEELGWRDYGGKHYESVFTRFYQGYILPLKFGIDKRKAHLSSLVCSGQITRQQALDALDKPMYDDKQLEMDKQFVLKKLGFSETEFDAYVEAPRVEHTAYKHDKGLTGTFPVLTKFRGLKRMVQ